jgi:antitoxin (DNA-binding transcriptional repressor) of toxin-antitoxin stability system
MKRYSVAAFRQNLARALDEVERGADVAVERRGRRFRIVPDTAAPRRRTQRPLFVLADRALLDREWHWEWRAGGVRLHVGRRRRRSSS